MSAGAARYRIGIGWAAPLPGGPEECSTYAAPWPRTRLFNARPRNAGGAADETQKCAAENAGSRTGSPAHSAQAAAVCTHGAAQSPLSHCPSPNRLQANYIVSQGV